MTSPRPPHDHQEIPLYIREGRRYLAVQSRERRGWPMHGIVAVGPGSMSVVCRYRSDISDTQALHRVGVQHYQDVIVRGLRLGSGPWVDHGALCDEPNGARQMAERVLAQMALGYREVAAAGARHTTDRMTPRSSCYAELPSGTMLVVPDGTRLYEKRGTRYVEYRDAFTGFTASGAWIVPDQDGDFRVSALRHLGDAPPPSVGELAHALPGLEAAFTGLVAERAACDERLKRTGSAMWMSDGAMTDRILNGLAGLPADVALRG